MTTALSGPTCTSCGTWPGIDHVAPGPVIVTVPNPVDSRPRFTTLPDVTSVPPLETVSEPTPELPTSTVPFAVSDSCIVRSA